MKLKHENPNLFIKRPNHFQKLQNNSVKNILKPESQDVGKQTNKKSGSKQSKDC